MAAEQVGNADLTELEISTHNNKFKKYEGLTIPTEELLTLQRELISHNQQEKKNGTNRVVRLISISEQEMMLVNEIDTPNIEFITGASNAGYKHYKLSLEYQNGLVTIVRYQGIKE